MQEIMLERVMPSTVLMDLEQKPNKSLLGHLVQDVEVRNLSKSSSNAPEANPPLLTFQNP